MGKHKQQLLTIATSHTRRRNQLDLQMGYICVYPLLFSMSLYQCRAHSWTMESALSLCLLCFYFGDEDHPTASYLNICRGRNGNTSQHTFFHTSWPMSEVEWVRANETVGWISTMLETLVSQLRPFSWGGAMTRFPNKKQWQIERLKTPWWHNADVNSTTGNVGNLSCQINRGESK